MGSIGRLLSMVFVSACAAGLLLSGTAVSASELRMPVDPRVVIVDDEGNPLPFEENALEANATASTDVTASADAAGDSVEAVADSEPETGVEKASKDMTAEAPKAASEKTTPKKASQPVHVISGFSVTSDVDGFVLVVKGVPADLTPKWFPLSSPERLVFDLSGNWNIRGSNVYRVDDGVVKHVVAGIHADKVRFVVHFREGAAIPKERPVFVHDDTTLSIRMK